MRKRDPQPAKKSYFFGPGFQDIGDFIRLSWEKNTREARDSHKKYRKAGLMSFAGQFHLFCSISVASFGTVFFLLISAAVLAVVSLFFLLAYLGFSAVWLLDRACLYRRKVFTACGECKSRFLIPAYICPKCGAYHTDLTPGAYGILRRTCRCGEKLPTAFFNGRKRLRAVCPECRRNGRITVLADREARPFCVPVVGGHSVGKTAYITAFSRTFIEQTAPAKGLEVEFYNQAKKDIYLEIRSDYDRGSTRVTPFTLGPGGTSAVSFSFFVKHKSLRPERLVHIYDIAGDVFTSGSENEIQRQYEYCHGIVFIIDPFSIPSVRARYDALLVPEDRANISRTDINSVISVFMNKLREVTGLSDQKMSKVPIAVVIGKTDSGGLVKVFSEENIRAVQSRTPERSVDPYDAMDFLCRDFLRKNGMESVVNAIELRFRVNRFFAVSAIGHARDHGAYMPVGVLAPMEWLCRQSDPKLHKLWGGYPFTKNPSCGGKEGGTP